MARRRRPRSDATATRRQYVDVAANSGGQTGHDRDADDELNEAPEQDEAKSSRGSAPFPKRAKNEPLDDVAYQARVTYAVQEAESFVDTIIMPQRLAAAQYYQGQPFGDEEEGRSQVVLTEVRDTVQAILPDLLRVFCSGEKWGDFAPRTPDAIERAEQASDTVNYIFQDVNKGFTILYSAFTDALVKKLGVITWECSEHAKVTERSFSGLTQEDVMFYVQNNPNAEVLNVEPEDPDPLSPPTYKLRVRVQQREKRYKVSAVPPENFIIDRRARDPETACDLIGVRDMVPVSDLIEQGFDEEEIREFGHPGRDDGLYWNIEKQQRTQGYLWPQDSTDESMQRVKYGVYYVRIDRDGDGIAELRRVKVIGDGGYILEDEIVDDIPYALFCPSPEPHTVYGWSIADWTMDLQKIKSHVMRDVLDSLGQTIFPTTYVVENQVNMDDVLNKEIGRVVRMRAPGMVQEQGSPFVGAQAQPILDYLDQIKAQRTGVTPASTGLDADLLQSTTKAAVTAQISSAQARTEMVSRIFAETGMVQLFRGLLRLICRHQDKPMVVRLRGKFVQVDPTTWDPDMDVSVNVGLGRGDDAQQMGFLTQIAQKQEQILQTLGPSNPLVSLAQYRATLAKIIQKAGFKNPDEFISPITPEQGQAMAQQMAAQKPPDPNQLLAKVEIAKAQANAYAQMQKVAEARVKLQLDADQARDKLEADVVIKCMEKGIDPNIVLQMINRPRPDITGLIQTLLDSERQANGIVLGQIGAASGQQQPGPPQPGQPQQPQGQPPQQGLPQNPMSSNPMSGAPPAGNPMVR